MAIFEFVKKFAGAPNCPKITGMMIDLPIPEIKQYLSSYELFKLRVHQACNLLISHTS